MTAREHRPFRKSIPPAKFLEKIYTRGFDSPPVHFTQLIERNNKLPELLNGGGRNGKAVRGFLRENERGGVAVTAVSSGAVF